MAKRKDDHKIIYNTFLAPAQLVIGGIFVTLVAAPGGFWGFQKLFKFIKLVVCIDLQIQIELLW